MRFFLATVFLMPVAMPAHAESHGEAQSFTAEVAGRDGAISGTATARTTRSGMMLVTVDLAGVPGGTHAVHIHETGDCSAQDFTSAGGHVAGDASHGVLSEDGPHPGDLPNVQAHGGSHLRTTHFNARLRPEHLGDEDGAAFVMHAGADDYASQPAGAAGARIACGVFEKDAM